MAGSMDACRIGMAGAETRLVGIEEDWSIVALAGGSFDTKVRDC